MSNIVLKKIIHARESGSIFTHAPQEKHAKQEWTNLLFKVANDA